MTIRSIAPNHEVTASDAYREGILAGMADAKDGLLTPNPEFANVSPDMQGMFRLGYNDGACDYALEHQDLWRDA